MTEPLSDPGRGKPLSHELTSLDERLGLLLLVRVGLALLVVVAAMFASKVAFFDIRQIGPVSAVYVTVAVAAEVYRRSHLKGRMQLHRLILPLDAIYLAVITTPSGGARSPLVILFAVQLIAVTILGSERTGLRVALWDTFLFVMIPTLSVAGDIASALGDHVYVSPNRSETALAIMGLWAVALCTAGFSSVSERELRRSKAHISALADMASRLERISDEEQILATLLATLVNAFSFRRGALWCTIGSRPVGLSVSGPGSDVMSAPVPPLARADRIAGEAWDDGAEVQLLRHLDTEENPVAAGLLPGATNVVVLPLQIERKDKKNKDKDGLGVLLLEQGGSPLKGRIPKRTLVLLGQFAAHAGLVLSNARLLAERERLAAIDGLTGLANRREFDRVLAREVSRAERSQEPLSLIVLDVDHFKAINDTRGHLGGDEALRAIADVLAAAVRDMDVVARYGGEEFAMVLPRCDQLDAIQVIERVTAGCGDRSELTGVTVSSGIATLPFNASDALSLVSAADEALYESKRSGRNRYSVSSRGIERSTSATKTGTIGVSRTA